MCTYVHIYTLEVGNLRPPRSHPKETIRPLIEVHGGLLGLRGLRIKTHIGSEVRIQAMMHPKGPSTNILMTVGFYVRNYEYGLGQVLIIQALGG